MTRQANAEEVILWRLAKKLDAPLKEDDGFKFKNIDNMILFLDIANRFNTIEVSEDYFLMSVLITPKPSRLIEKQANTTVVIDTSKVWKEGI